MKSSLTFLASLMFIAGLTMLGRVPVAAAEGGSIPADRLERLERRVNEMAERQEQLLRRLERQNPMAQPGEVNIHPQAGPAVAPASIAQHPQAARIAKSVQDTLGLLFLVGVICNILLAIWIFTDIRKRGEGSGIFVAMALVAGIPAALIYSLTRIGDRKA